MDTKSLTVLEFDKIRRRLADFTAFSGGRQKALAVEPVSDPDTVAARLDRTREAWDYTDRKGRLPLAGAHDMRSEIESAERGRTLLAAELVDIRETLEAARRVRRGLLRESARWPRLSDIAQDLEECPALFDALAGALDDEGNVLDDASPELRALRRNLHVAHDRLTRQVEGILQDSRLREYLQEPIVTQRGGRYVVPVKAQFRAKVPGVVHDTSDSGATVFVEPLGVVELGNRYRELKIAEEREVDRVLRELSGFVGGEAAALGDTIEGLARLDFVFASADYGASLRGVIPEMVAAAEPFLSYPAARHPLLQQDSVVPVDVEVGISFRLLVITGPNTGGKTVTLKTIGLLTAMAQAGLPIPAGDGARFACFDTVFADIGDEQSIEQSLSTFSGHLTNIVHILARANRASLVLLDELGAGTDPLEGASLAVALLDHLRDRGIATAASTHYSELKTYAHTTEGVMNASVEFDVATLQPTFELVMGLPGKSNALAIARRLGLPEAIVAAARAGMSTDAAAMEDLLAEIRAARREAEAERAAALEAREEADAWAKKLDGALADLSSERQRMLSETRQQAADELEAARKAIEALTRRAREAAALGRVSEVEETGAAARRATDEVAELVPPVPVPAPEKPAKPEQIAPGVWVHIPRYDLDGQVLDVRGDGSVEVAMGQLKVALDIGDLEVIGDAESVRHAAASSGGPGGGTQSGSGFASAGAGQGGAGGTPGGVPLELDLRGLRVEEGLRELDRRLDRAVLAGLPWVQVIHGHGTGAMKAAVREALRGHAQVMRFRPGEQGEGGDGVTVVYLR